MEEFGNVASGKDKTVAGKELVAIEHDMASLQHGDSKIWFIMPFCAHLADSHQSEISPEKTSAAGPVI